MTEPAKEAETHPAQSNPHPSSQYEFGVEENKVFTDLSYNLRAAGWAIILGLTVYHGVLLGRWITNSIPMYGQFRSLQILVPLLLLLISLSFLRAAGAFQKIVDTQGSDITHLMTGLTELNEFYSWFVGVWLILFVAVILGGVAALAHMFGY